MRQNKPTFFMAELQHIVEYTNDFLNASAFSDYCPNGLQVEGAASVTKLASGVTASLAFIEAAQDWGAECLLVHHGYFWKNETAPVVGMKKKRIQRLLAADTSLLAYHLPLDAHPVVGNNAQLAQELGIQITEPLQKNARWPIGNVGKLAHAMPIRDFVDTCQRVLKREPLHVAGGPEQVERIAWCTGGAQHMIEDAVSAGADVYLTGEISEQTTHIARECNLHFIAAGHHATERYGAQALGNHLADKFGVEHRFFDIDNPA